MELTAKLYRALQKTCKMVDFENRRLRFKHWLCSQITTFRKIWVSPYCCSIGSSAGKTCLKVTSVLQKPPKFPTLGFLTSRKQISDVNLTQNTEQLNTDSEAWLPWDLSWLSESLCIPTAAYVHVLVPMGTCVFPWPRCCCCYLKCSPQSQIVKGIATAQQQWVNNP